MPPVVKGFHAHETQSKIVLIRRRYANALPCCAPSFLSLTLASAQTPKSLSPFDQQLIDQEKQFLQAIQDKNVALLRQSVADDFRGIGTNGDFYDKSEVTEGGLPKDTRSYDFRVVKLNDDSAIVAYNLVVPGGHPRYRHMTDTWAKSRRPMETQIPAGHTQSVERERF